MSVRCYSCVLQNPITPFASIASAFVAYALGFTLQTISLTGTDFDPQRLSSPRTTKMVAITKLSALLALAGTAFGRWHYNLRIWRYTDDHCGDGVNDDTTCIDKEPLGLSLKQGKSLSFCLPIYSVLTANADVRWQSTACHETTVSPLPATVSRWLGTRGTRSQEMVASSTVVGRPTRTTATVTSRSSKATSALENTSAEASA